MAEALVQRGSVTETLGHYHIGERIGAGGMGEVYRARDAHLEREVAIKVLPPGMLADPVARRYFRKEALALSKLNHPNIATVYDFDTQEGKDFLVMEFIAGVSLNDRLQAGPLTGADVVDFGVQMAEGLEAAHRQSIVHRDLKPKNLRITPEGRLKILDFGLARLLTTAEPAQEVTASQCDTWIMAGTLQYMSPEQLRGEPADHRSDIWAAGVVLYEMATARLPFSGKVHAATADAIQHQAVVPPSRWVDSISPRLEAIILRCLEKDPCARYQSAKELEEDLRTALLNAAPLRRAWAGLPARAWRRVFRAPIARLGLYLLLVAMVAGGAWKLAHRSVQPAPQEAKYLAVLPFVAVDPDSNARAFSQGLSEALTARLARLGEEYPLQVVSASEVRAQGITSVQQASMGLGVSLVLEGSFHEAGGRVRVTFDLVDARSRRVLRADTITASAGDPFGLEDRVVEGALHALDVELSAQEQRQLSARGTTQPSAYDFYLRGRGYLQDYQKLENIENAIQAFRSALTLDATYAPAHAGLGESYWQKYELTHDRQWVEQAEMACRQASLAGAGHGCLGTVYNGTGKYEQAVREFQLELAANSSSDTAYRGLAAAYENLGKLPDAEETYRRAIKMRPQYWGGYSHLGAFFYRHGRYEEAAQAFTRVTELTPDNVRGYSNLGGLEVAIGRYAEAVPVLERSIQIQPTPDAWSNLGTAHFYLHRFAEAARSYEQAVKLDEPNRTSWGNLGDAYYWAPGRRPEAAAAYRKAIALGEDELRVNQRDAELLSWLAVYHAMLGEKQAATSDLARALSLGADDGEVLFNAALTANQLGNTRDSIAWLRKALSTGLSPALVRSHPNFENLQSDRRFQEILRQAGKSS